MPSSHLQPTADWRADSAAPTGGLLRYLTSEMLVGIAMALTILAVAYREPLTTRTRDFGPQSLGKDFYTYTYDDSSSGGRSRAVADAHRPLAWTCNLRGPFPWPYCGFGLLFDRNNSGKGINLGGRQTLSVTLDHAGSGRLIRVSLKDRQPEYRQLPTAADKVNQASFAIRPGTQTIEIDPRAFAVAEWWKDQTRAPAELAVPSFGNIVAMEFVSGAEGATGAETLRIRSIRLERHLMEPGEYYALLAGLWALLIGGLLIQRRRQLANVRRASELALRQSERLHRTILETSTECIVLFDPEDRIEFVNRAGLRALELPPLRRILGQHWTHLWGQDCVDHVADALARAKQGETVRLRGPGPTARGTRRWWDAVVTPMLDDGGALKGVLSVSRDVTAERERSEQLKWASEHDPLTQLPNRGAFHARLQAATLRAMQSGGRIGLLLIDLDHFKQVNDTLGHGAGDELLGAIGRRLRACVRKEDFVARIGGDEFAVILEEVRSAESLLNVGDEILSCLHAPVEAGGRMHAASASIGGAMYPQQAGSADELFRNADTALYALKHSGRGGTRLFDTYMLDQAEKCASQLSLAREAIDLRSLIAVYQPKTALDANGPVGVEALLRWRDAGGRLHAPATLMEAFKDYELAARIGELMQQQVARDVREWIRGGVAFGTVSINASPAEFLRDDYAERLLAVLEAHDVPPHRIEIEVTEHALLGRGPEYVARALRTLSAAGVTISLDDFGTGCSSLSHLRDFPVDVLKIDMSFVQQMTDDPEIAAIVSAVVNLARSLSIKVVAEGVETTEQLDLLRAMGCHMAQGHLFGPAAEASQVPAMFPRVRAAA